MPRKVGELGKEIWEKKEIRGKKEIWEKNENQGKRESIVKPQDLK